MKIETWTRLPAAVRDHLVERMRDRNIGLEDLNQLRLWMESKPDVPEAAWYKDFGSFNFAAKAKIQRHSFCRASWREGKSFKSGISCPNP
jgi:hypothetical protein